MKLAAKIISFAMHPLLMPTYLFLIVTLFIPIWLKPLGQASMLKLLLLIFGMTFILPVINFLFFRFTGTIRDLALPHRENRIMPFIFISLVFGAVTVMFNLRLPVSGIVNLFIIMTTMVVISTILTFFIKVSIHAVAASGLASTVLAGNRYSESQYLLFISLAIVILAGLTMSSRLLLNAHTLREVIIGAGVGFVTGWLGVIWIL